MYLEKVSGFGLKYVNFKHFHDLEYFCEFEWGQNRVQGRNLFGFRGCKLSGLGVEAHKKKLISTLQRQSF